MTSEIDSLQERVDAIRATGNPELVRRAYIALGQELREFARKTLNRKRFPIIQRVNQADVEWLLGELADRAHGRS